MKFLAFTDIHQDREALKRLVMRAAKKDIDFVLCAGDISTFGKGLHVVLKAFNNLGKPFYVVPGNHEEGGVLLSSAVELYSYCINLHTKAFEIGGFVLVGYGGGGFAHEDAAFRRCAREWYGKYNGCKIIFVTHGPAYGLKVDLFHDHHVGNKDYRVFIEKINPKIVVCGHLHETAGVVERVGKTVVLNPGWEGKVVEIK